MKLTIFTNPSSSLRPAHILTRLSQYINHLWPQTVEVYVAPTYTPIYESVRNWFSDYTLASVHRMVPPQDSDYESLSSRLIDRSDWIILMTVNPLSSARYRRAMEWTARSGKPYAEMQCRLNDAATPLCRKIERVETIYLSDASFFNLPRGE